MDRWGPKHVELKLKCWLKLIHWDHILYLVGLYIYIKLHFQKHEICVSLFMFPKINILIAFHVVCRQRGQFSCVVPWKKKGCGSLLYVNFKHEESISSTTFCVSSLCVTIFVSWWRMLSVVCLYRKIIVLDSADRTAQGIK